MDTRIDPAADAIWDSVAYIATERGVEDRRPRSDEDWQSVRASAMALLTATRELGAATPHVAAVSKDPGPGELSPAEIQRRIAANPAAFNGFAHGLEAAGQKALAAIDARDVQALMDAGGIIDEACEACHVTYWYPDQARLTR
jgi:cytochrome c556